MSKPQTDIDSNERLLRLLALTAEQQRGAAEEPPPTEAQLAAFRAGRLSEEESEPIYRWFTRNPVARAELLAEAQRPSTARTRRSTEWFAMFGEWLGERPLLVGAAFANLLLIVGLLVWVTPTEVDPLDQRLAEDYRWLIEHVDGQAIAPGAAERPDRQGQLGFAPNQINDPNSRAYAVGLERGWARLAGRAVEPTSQRQPTGFQHLGEWAPLVRGAAERRLSDAGFWRRQAEQFAAIRAQLPTDGLAVTELSPHLNALSAALSKAAEATPDHRAITVALERIRLGLLPFDGG